MPELPEILLDTPYEIPAQEAVTILPAVLTHFEANPNWTTGKWPAKATFSPRGSDGKVVVAKTESTLFADLQEDVADFPNVMGQGLGVFLYTLSKIKPVKSIGKKIAEGLADIAAKQQPIDAANARLVKLNADLALQQAAVTMWTAENPGTYTAEVIAQHLTIEQNAVTKTQAAIAVVTPTDDALAALVFAQKNVWDTLLSAWVAAAAATGESPAPTMPRELAGLTRPEGI